MSETDGSVIPVYRWFESDGLFMAIDQASGSSLDELGVTPEFHKDVPDLIDALLLADQDPLLQCLDAWSDHVFNWKPVRLDAVVAGSDDVANHDDSELATKPLHQQTSLPKLTVSLSSLEGQKRTVYLAIPHDELVQMPGLPEQWQSLVTLTQHAHLHEVVLQETVLSAAEIEKLKPGAFVLISGSFSDDWLIGLNNLARATDENDTPASMKAQLRVDKNTIRLLEPDSRESTAEQEPELNGVEQRITAADTEQSLEASVCIALETPILVNQLYVQSAWLSGHNVLISLPETLDGARVQIVRKTGVQTTLPGRVMSLGEGYGVLLSDASVTTTGNQD